MKKLVSLALILCMAFAFAACSSGSSEDSSGDAPQVSLEITAINQFGEPVLNMTPEEFNELGFAPGDSVDVTVGDDIVLEDIPYFDGIYGKRNAERVLAYMGYLMVSAQPSGFANVHDVSKGDKVTITLREKEGQMKLYKLYSATYSDDPADFDSTEAFINAREVKVAGIKSGTLYRGASPFDNTRGRAEAVSEYLEEKGINTVVNLAQSEETVMEDYDSLPEYSKTLIDEGKVIFAEMSNDYQSENYSKALAETLTKMSEMEGPYYIHCLEGKDRSGFVCAVLEALCGATDNEIIDDFMLSFENYYNLEPGSKKYELMKDEGIVPMLQYIAGDEKADIDSIDPQKAAESYLENIGLDQSAINNLKEKLAD